jgi:gliding motility-associated-like protein
MNLKKYLIDEEIKIEKTITETINNLDLQLVVIDKYDMKIYNRYGQKVYDNDVCLNAWDGRYMDEIAQEGTYVYLITAWDMAGKSYQFRGSVTLLR